MSGFQTKPEIALAQFRSLLDEDGYRVAWCWPMRPMEMITASVRSWRRWDCNMSWASCLLSLLVWPPGATLRFRPRGPQCQRAPCQSLCAKNKHHQPLSVKELASVSVPGDWRQRKQQREGTRGTMHSRFTRPARAWQPIATTGAVNRILSSGC